MKGGHVVARNNHVPPKGENAYNWKGGRRENSQGYILIHTPDHTNADNDGYVREHVFVAEKALDKVLPKKVVVHHIDEIKGHNENTNLVICEDENYHRLLHTRLRAYKATGDPHKRKCWICKKYDYQSALVRDGSGFRHSACKTLYNKQRRLSAWKFT
jgi:hypothetical protein